MTVRPAGRVLPLLVTLALAAPAFAQGPRTVAETSDYRATSKHAEVVAFCDQPAKASPLVRLTEIGTSGEGRKLPMLLVADPPVATPEQVAASGKLLVLVQGAIHAGEIDGKEAILA